jgi:hypothetical protein
MAGKMPKDLKDYIPALDDQGIKNLVATPARGKSIQEVQVAMPADGIIVFADNGLEDMDNTDYRVIIHNHTGTEQGLVTNANRLVTQFTITTSGGPTADDVLDIVIVGKTKGQLG